MEASKKLLLLEDDLALGEILIIVFIRTGHGVTWFVRARIQDGSLILMDANSKENVFKPEYHELALVDYRLKGSPLDGPEVTSYLVKAGVPVVGISGLQQLNAILINAGARGGISKDQLIRKVLLKELLIDIGFAGVN